jgi:drug/metabolite transporter (DMT)-like permease
MTPTLLQRSLLFMVVFTGLWALVELLAAHLLRAYSGFEVVWIRYGVHLGFMLAVWGWRDPLSLFVTRKPLFQLGRSALMLVMPAAYILGSIEGAGSLMGLFWISPLLIVAFGAIFLRERPARLTWVACVLATVGAILMSRPSSVRNSALLAWPVIMAVSFALYVVMTRVMRDESTRTNLFYTALAVFMLLTPLVPFVWVTPSLHDAAIFLGIGLLGYLGLAALDRMTHAAPVSYAAPLASTQMIFTVTLASVAGHQRMGLVIWAGLALVFCSMVLALIPVLTSADQPAP